jgi:type II secretory pathway pseudopilin PulG
MQKVSAGARGFFLIEVIVATAIIATVLILLVGAIQDSVEVSKRALERTQAAYLLEEGVEAVKSVRDTAWSTIAGLTSGTTYYLSWTGSAWALTTTPSTIDVFTRTIVCATVYRDANDDIATSGTADTGTRSCTVTVAWSAPSGTQSQNLTFYISDISS